MDREELIKDIERQMSEPTNEYVVLWFSEAEYVLELLKEKEEREKAICKEICDFIRGACSTDTEDDKDFVCYEIQKCFTRSGMRLIDADGERKSN